MSRRVTPDTIIGHVTVRASAEMLRGPVDALVESIQDLIDRKLLRWIPDEDRVAIMPRIVRPTVLTR